MNNFFDPWNNPQECAASAVDKVSRHYGNAGLIHLRRELRREWRKAFGLFGWRYWLGMWKPEPMIEYRELLNDPETFKREFLGTFRPMDHAENHQRFVTGTYKKDNPKPMSQSEAQDHATKNAVYPPL